MDRLTYKRSLDGFEDVGLRDGITVGDAVCRLAEYEDAGLEPEEILTGKELAEVACALISLKEYKSLGTIDHIRELLQAENDGRLVVLPCKVGDTVYRVIRAKNGSGHVAAANVSGLHLGDTTRNCRYRKEYEYVVLKVDGGFCAHVNKKDFGKTVFLTLEEAEAALAKKKDNK